MKSFIIILFSFILLQSCSKHPVADFTWSPETPKAGEEVQFTNLSKDARSFSWNLGDMNISSEENPKHIYQDSGVYIIDLFAIRGLSSNEKTVEITIKP